MAAWRYASTCLAVLAMCSVTVTWFLIQYVIEPAVTLRTVADVDLSMNFGPKRYAIRQSGRTRWSKQTPLEVVKWKVFIQSAIVNRQSSNLTHTAVILTSWHYHSHRDPFHCCFQFVDGSVVAVLAESLLSYPRGSLQASQFVCLVSKNITVLPKVFFSVSDCTQHVTQTIPIVYPERVAGGMAVCAKTIYHDVDVGQMVEWFELQRLQGVNRIQAFHFQLRGEQKQVLEYYSMLGYLLLHPLVLPVGLGAPPGRGYDEDERPDEEQFAADEQITLFDCIARQSGHDYVGVYGVDEVLVPEERNIPLPNFLKKMELLEPKAGDFVFNQERFVKDWGKSNAKSNLTMTSYVLRVLPRVKGRNVVYLPSKMLVEPYNTSPVEPSSAAAFHLYNFCNKYDKPWCDTVNRTEDRQLLRYEMALSLNVEKARVDIQNLSNKTKNTLHN